MNKKHMLLMGLCCVVGMGAVVAITLFKVPVNSVVTIGLLLLCQLSHVLMMAFMGKDHDHGMGGQMDHSHHATNVVDAHSKPSRAR